MSFGGLSSSIPNSRNIPSPSKAATSHLLPLPADICYLRVSVAGTSSETIVIRLFQKECPQTCRNFVALCTNDNDGGNTTGTTEAKQTKITTSRSKPYPIYRGCEFHRIIDGFMVQTGDFERFDGTGGYSPIYPNGKFNDESFTIGHDTAGIVSMANSGKNTNKSQFFITLKATPHLNGKHVAFGQVIQGMNVIYKMLDVERIVETGRPIPLQRIIITDCGIGRGDDDDDDDGHDTKDNHDKNQHQKVRSKEDYKKSKKHKKKHHKKRKKSGKKHSRNHDGPDNQEEEDDKDDDSSSAVSSKDYEKHRRRRRHHKTKRRKRSHDNDDSDSDSSTSRSNNSSSSDDDDDKSSDSDSNDDDQNDSSSRHHHSKKHRKRKHDKKKKKRKHKSRH